MYSFAVHLADLGEVEVDYVVTDPGMKPRYGEDPDPGHEPEIIIEHVRLNGAYCGFDGLYIKVPWRYVPVDEWLLEQAYEHHARHGA